MFRLAVIPAALLVILLTACTGYRLGGSQPSHLSDIRSIQVAVVQNQTQMPRAGAHATNAIANALIQDGTYLLGSANGADARLETTLTSIDYSQLRSTRFDALRSAEIEMTVEFKWTLVDASDPRHILEAGKTTGSTSFFVAPNFQTARQNALPDALKRAADSMIGRLADSF
jgi:outer membrane lipopolysaccharide assembly protein LptE/RlpB